MEFALITLLLVLLIAWLAGLVANRIGFPAILGELGAGILFGPALLGAIILDPAIPIIGGARLGFAASVPGLDVLAEIGVFLLLLYIGMEIDFRDLIKAGKAGLWAAVGGFIVPFGSGVLIARAFDVSLAGALFLGLAMGVTSIATKSRILVDLKLIGTRIANVLIAGALISDTAVLVVFALILGVAGAETFQLGSIVWVLLKAVLFFVIATLVGLKFLPVLGDYIRRLGLHERTGSFTLVLLIGLIYAELAHLLGLHAIIGALMAGLFLREGVLSGRLSHEIAVLVRDLSVGFLAPIFFVTAGFHVSLNVIATDTMLVIIVLVMATLTKILGTAVFYVLGRFQWREGIVIGCGMNGRGAVEIIIAEFALEMGLITRDVFSILVLMAFFTTVTVPIFLKWGTAWLKSRGELVRSDEARRGVIMIGSSPLARLLAHEVTKGGEDAILIDSNPGRCEAARRQRLQVLEGNALNEEMMTVAGARDARLMVAFTTNAEVNSVALQTARELFGVPETASIIPLSTEPDGQAHTSNVFAGNGFQYEKWEYMVLRDQIERIESQVVESSELPEFLKSVEPVRDSAALCIRRSQKTLLPGQLSQLKPGDSVVYLRQKESTAVETRRARFKTLVAECPLLDIRNSISLDDFFSQVAETMADRLGESPKELKRRLLEREAESSTLIIQGLAIPHAEVSGEGRFDMMIARSLRGIPFLEEGTLAYTIFVLFTSRDERNQHLRALSSIAQIMQTPGIEKKWAEALDEEALRRVILKALGEG